MKNSEWPSAISGNRFGLADHDPNIPPDRYKITTWSNLFGEGGSVSLDAYMADGKRVGLAQISVKRSGPVRAERDHLQGLLDEWQEDAAQNWHDLISGAIAYVTDYYRRQIADYSEKLNELPAVTA